MAIIYIYMLKIKPLQTSLIFKYFIWVNYQSLQALSYAFLCHMYVAMCTTEKYDIDYFSCDCYSQRQIPKNPCEVEIATAMTIIRIITIDGSIDYIDDIMVMLLDH